MPELALFMLRIDGIDVFVCVVKVYPIGGRAISLYNPIDNPNSVVAFRGILKVLARCIMYTMIEIFCTSRLDR